ncbi:Cytochrome c-type biogenesis protein CcmF [bacterium HR17]|uniref:Cytochrome c-type biogenesis protein CcmF n=1 Tax=Candidatus Fervidibacter japonicus TaxID=2035412 RepID=A0A2H5XAK9_9BACT|nr:Cytochrome c-type biogenesis protein CcmF [bacterium HR17]
MWLGRILVWAAMLAAFLTAWHYWRAETLSQTQHKKRDGHTQALTAARRWFWLTGALIVAAMVYLWSLILTQRYEVAYVHDYTNRDLPMLYRFAAFWGGQAGTWLLWAFFTTLWGLLLRRFAAPYETATLAILGGLNFLLLLPVGVSGMAAALAEWGVRWRPVINAALEDPFLRLHPAPMDGKGLNPLLQNPWMAIHPPNMFAGYSAMALPFALALAGLWRKDWHGWARYALPAACLGTFQLGLGITLGGVWSYEVLGWGGYWAWDPVENASFIPWLGCAGLMHCLIAYRSTKSGVRLATLLALLTFLTAYYATFVTRSGFIQSVHNFTTTAITWWVMGILFFLTIASFGLFFVRMRHWTESERQPIAGDFTSLPFFAYAGTIVLGVFALIVFIGLSAPWVTIIGKGLGLKMQEIGVERVFYDRASFPIALVMCLLLALMPLLVIARPKDAEQWQIWKASVPWLVVNIALFTALVAFLFGIRQPVSLALVAVASACIIGNLWALYLRARQSPLTAGAYLAHLGLGIFLLGVVGSELRDDSRQLIIPTGEHRSAFGWLFTYTGLKTRPDGKVEAILHAQQLDGKGTFTANPIFWDTQFGLVREPFIRRTLTHDIYIEPIEQQDPQEAGTVTLRRGEAVQVGKWQIKFDRFELSGKPIMGMPEKITAVVELNDGTRTHVLRPFWRLKPNGVEESPDRIAGTNIEVGIERINAEERTVTLRINGVGLQGHNGFIVVNVQRKPGVNLVWLGVAMVLLGALLSSVRRIRETMKAQMVTTTAERRKVKKAIA